MKRIAIDESGLHIVLGITENKQVKLLHFSYAEYDEAAFEDIDLESTEAFPLVQVSYAGDNWPQETFGNERCVTAPGYRLKYVNLTDEQNELGRRLVMTQSDEETGAYVATVWQFYRGLSLLRTWTTVTNQGQQPQTLEYVSVFSYLGIEKEGKLPYNDKLELHIPHHGWMKEFSWHTLKLADLGLGQAQTHMYQRSSSQITVSNTGNWSTKEALPMGYLANTEADTALFWQIEHNGSWQWEISDQKGHLYLNVCGPTELHSHWSKTLAPGESFTTVPAAVGVSRNRLNDAFAALTRYRRIIRRPNADNETLPVIFNDYMNCLMADPTTEKELPMIDAAAEAGCEYYCIDAGWYSDGIWWDNVGEWQEARGRFPGGLREVTDAIRRKGMTPGLWLEPEVMGIHCPLADKLPDDWFFMRHGKRVVYRSRYQLDYRNPEVIAHMNAIVDRLVNQYGVGYFKFDYNIEPGIGTELRADSAGDGLLEHERAVLRWLDGLFERHPGLVIENCSSGGLRMDYALLSRCSVQSTSDQEDYLPYAVISANAVSGVTPEQAAVWSYPQRAERPEKPGSLRAQADLEEETIYNMVNALLLRIQQSGHLPQLSPERFALVKEGIAYYKRIRGDIRVSVPYWPNGFAGTGDTLLASGHIAGRTLRLAVWRRGGGEQELTASLAETCEKMGGAPVSVRCAYPEGRPVVFRYDAETMNLHVQLPKLVMARVLEIAF